MEKDYAYIYRENSLSLGIEQHSEHFLEFLDYEAFEAMIKVEYFLFVTAFESVTFSVETSVEEMKPVLTEEKDSEHGKKSILTASFGISGLLLEF